MHEFDGEQNVCPGDLFHIVMSVLFVSMLYTTKEFNAILVESQKFDLSSCFPLEEEELLECRGAVTNRTGYSSRQGFERRRSQFISATENPEAQLADSIMKQDPTLRFMEIDGRGSVPRWSTYCAYDPSLFCSNVM